MNDKKLFQTYIVNYAFATNEGILRNASRLVTAQTPDQARAATIQTLSAKHHYFRISKISTTTNDNAQPQL